MSKATAAEVLGHDALDCVETQTQSFTNWLGCEERFEDAILTFLGNTTATGLEVWRLTAISPSRTNRRWHGGAPWLKTSSPSRTDRSVPASAIHPNSSRVKPFSSSIVRRAAIRCSRLGASRFSVVEAERFDITMRRRKTERSTPLELSDVPGRPPGERCRAFLRASRSVRIP